ncbi:IclR family transcriptional regulator [Mesorhizobium sp. YIM 152430]|uniref:IclR family transcriptional regulator n=1 Tax=Mesorhizobium sp. YIM 152430 TaxID=3031761 RepID=UPI0023DB01BC|nr:IclR family transcriptional regulator [Mesorhizobium sp. YIM 152430]MDF1600912.1 IclR family transcriptional regulator [Mesorhizobium sp. YIM 152430]
MIERDNRLFVESVERGFEVLRAFRGTFSLSLTELSDRAGITKSAAQRFTHTFEVLGFLRRDSSKRWSLTPRALEFGTYYLASDPLLERANPHLNELNHECGESVNLSQPDGTDMVYMARFTANRRFFIHMPIGTRIPMYCAASGRAYLSTQPRDDARLLVEHAARRAFTAKTITDVDAIMELVDEARDQGFAKASEEFYVGDLNIAAPIISADGQTLGCVNISGPTSRWSMERMEAELAPLLIQTVRTISSGGYLHSQQ